MNKKVRERVWRVLEDWFYEIGGGSIVMTWRNTAAPTQQEILVLGEPSKELVEHEGVILVRSDAAAL